MDLLLHFLVKKMIIFTLQFLGFLGKTGQNFPKLSLNSKSGFTSTSIKNKIAF